MNLSSSVIVMVFANASLADAIHWRKIDPHFQDPTAKRARHEAPGPIARFPGSDVGWQLALRFVDMLGAKKP